MTSICFGALMDALGDGGCMRHLRYQMHVAIASTATSRQPPSERPMARPGPASCGEGGDRGGSGDGGGGDGGGGEGASRVT